MEYTMIPYFLLKEWRDIWKDQAPFVAMFKQILTFPIPC